MRAYELNVDADKWVYFDLIIIFFSQNWCDSIFQLSKILSY